MSNLPITVRRAIELMGIYFLGVIIFVGKDVITPLLMAFFLAIMLLPVYRFFRKRKLPETLSITAALLFLLIVVGLVVWFFSSQVSRLVSDFPEIKKNVSIHLQSLSAWINDKTDFSTKSQLQLINDQSEKLLTYAGNVLTGAASSVTSVVIFIGLLPIYIFLFLFYRQKINNFLRSPNQFGLCHLSLKKIV